MDNRGRVYIDDFNGIQVFDPDGRYLARFSIPKPVRDMAITDNNELWVVTSDQMVSKFIIVK